MRRRWTTPAAIAAVGLLGLALLAGPALSAPTPAQTQTEWGDEFSCTTNSQGYCTVTHPRGVAPDSVTVTPKAAAITSVDLLTATSFRVRFAKSISSNGTVSPFALVTRDFLRTPRLGRAGGPATHHYPAEHDPAADG